MNPLLPPQSFRRQARRLLLASIVGVGALVMAIVKGQQPLQADRSFAPVSDPLGADSEGECFLDEVNGKGGNLHTAAVGASVEFGGWFFGAGEAPQIAVRLVSKTQPEQWFEVAGRRKPRMDVNAAKRTAFRNPGFLARGVLAGVPAGLYSIELVRPLPAGRGRCRTPIELNVMTVPG